MVMPEAMKRLGLALLAIILGSCMEACACHKPPEVTRIGIMRPQALRVLAEGWDTAQNANEKGYCVTIAYHAPYPDPRLADSVYVVWSVTPAPTDSAGPTWVNYHCPVGDPSVHTHPWHGAPPDCDPSKPDRQSLKHERAPFAVVQCDRYTFRFFYPRSND